MLLSARRLAAGARCTRGSRVAYNRIQANRLLNARELELFEASLGEPLRELTAPRLRLLIRRARALRDKSQDLLRRQRLETRRRTGSKAGVGGTANERTAQKARAFGEMLQRFEKRLGQLEAAALRAARKTAAARKQAALATKRGAQAAAAAARQRDVSPKAPARPPSASGTALGAGTMRARADALAMKVKSAGIQTIQGHVSSAGRREQARRDRRR